MIEEGENYARAKLAAHAKPMAEGLTETGIEQALLALSEEVVVNELAEITFDKLL